MSKKIIKRKGTSKKSVVKRKSTKTTPAVKKGIKKSAKQDEASVKLITAILRGIEEKKGNNALVLDLTQTDSSICDYFILCDGNSKTQVDAIARSVEEIVKKQTGQNPYHREGYKNAEWILIDYINVLVHVFQPDIRAFYKLETLWADAEVKKTSDYLK